mmetsp:Transcript_42522/g.79290  ORF Transcript_42522/g.79290 Transcript_42522/m.79290 type:complete len:91 (-) Transcript_42522:241-513(-)
MCVGDPQWQKLWCHEWSKWCKKVAQPKPAQMVPKTSTKKETAGAQSFLGDALLSPRVAQAQARRRATIARTTATRWQSGKEPHGIGFIGA